ncbi:MAG: hypothetical protein HY609_00330 [Deltaproteobacteria bacterium]|nr:hypothetical protein [Deltaproteobacteria bacterium]MBI4223353.1 hypothetical protein [Deltaproteobacteria bacterium]
MKIANLLILLATLGRLVPHPANMTPVGAVSLVGGAKLNGLWRWATPFIALILSDLLLKIFFNVPPFSFQTLFVYAAFAVNIFLGRFISGNKRYLKLGGWCAAGSLQFFVLTNLAVWLEGFYPPTLAGLGQCYVAAIPFLKNSLLGDLAWAYGLFAVIDRAQAWELRTRDQGLGTTDLRV